jgi:zinc resistance-associated protein
MKKIWLAGFAMAVGLVLIGVTVYAGGGAGYGCGPCGHGAGAISGKPVDTAAFRAFQKETLPLRDEMMAKRLDIRNEYLKEKPDQNRIAALQKEMIDLRTKIRTAAEKQGLPAAGFGQGCGQRMAGGPGYGGRGCGGRGFGGRGPGSGPCPMQ